MSYKKSATSNFRQKKRPPIAEQYLHPIRPMGVKDGTQAALKSPTKRQERKYDGSRACVIKDFDSIQIMGSRNWVNDYGLKHPELKEALRKAIPVDRFIGDAEFVFFKKGTDRDFFLNAMSGPETIAEYDGVAKIVLFDVLYVDSDSLEHLTYDDRHEILKTMIPKDTDLVIVPKSVKKVVDKEKQVKELQDRKLEGVVEKEADSPYIQGDTSSGYWEKLKNWKSDDAVVFGATEGNGKNASTFGSVIIAQRGKDGKLRYVGKAAGFKGDEATKMVNVLKQHQVSKCPIEGLPPDVAKEVKIWCKPVQAGVIEVKYLNRMEKSGLLRMPDFFRWRPDKPLKDVRIPT